MKRIFYFLVAAMIFTACGSSKKMLQRGNYDAAIQKSVTKLRKKPDNVKEAVNLDEAYRRSNELDDERVRFLEREDNPDNYDEVFAIYERMKNRQSLVRTVLPLNANGRRIDYEYVDYDARIISAKRKAAAYFSQNGQNLMKTGTKEAYREAYVEMSKAQDYSGGMYPELDPLIEEARLKGISRVIVLVNNMTQLKLDPQFEEDLLEIDNRGLNSDWIEYHFRHLDEDISYDYTIYVNLESIAVSPDDTKEEDKLYKKEVEDGFDYVLDANGNVMKDTAGNDIKIQKFREITCTLVETHQFKSVEIRGEVEILSLNPERLIQQEPFGAANQFEHVSARSIGDEDALTEEALIKTQQEKIPFPTDVDMVLMCTETIKPAIRNAIYANRQYIQ